MDVRWTMEAERDRMFARLANDWPQLAGARIFMTGGTGFIGRWMLEALADANRRLNLGVEAVILSRDPDAFARKAEHLATDPAITLVRGDVLRFEPPEGQFTHLVHAATDASADLTENDPRRMFDTIVGGTRRTLDHALAQKARYFFLSSGAVYGSQPWETSHVGEDWLGGPDIGNARNAYAEGKRAAEMLCAIYRKQFALDIVTARIFALLGPLLSLDIHFAAGNFIRDALAGRSIRVEGAGTAVRSYLYIADLTVWLWKILLRAAPGSVYNTGSEEAVSIAELARLVGELLGAPGVDILGRPDPGWNPGRYVPSSAKIRNELGVEAETSLGEAILRTAQANGWNA